MLSVVNNKNNIIMRKATRAQWVKFAIVTVLYLAFLIWVKSWLGLIVVPFIFDIYISKKIPWGFWDTRERCHFRGRCMLVRRPLSSQPGSHPVENVCQKNRSCGYLYSAWERRCWSGLRCTSHLPDRVIPISTAYRGAITCHFCRLSGSF